MMPALHHVTEPLSAAEDSNHVALKSCKDQDVWLTLSPLRCEHDRSTAKTIYVSNTRTRQLCSTPAWCSCLGWWDTSLEASKFGTGCLYAGHK